VGLSWDYPLKTRTNKQPIGEVPGYEIILSHPLKYPRSKRGLNQYGSTVFPKTSFGGSDLASIVLGVFGENTCFI
jgi:hypothetical protein